MSSASAAVDAEFAQTGFERPVRPLENPDRSPRLHQALIRGLEDPIRVGDGVPELFEIVQLARRPMITREPTGLPAGLDLRDDPNERRKLRVVDFSQLEIRLTRFSMPIHDFVDYALVNRYVALPVGSPFLNELPEPFFEQ